jgi:hypothetical protein
MKTTVTATKETAFKLRDSKTNGHKATIIGANHGTFFVKTGDGIMEYSDNEMSEIYGLGDDDMRVIRTNLKY